jgi:glycosyltransferase involved in cell wall biosynthesis
VSVGGICPRKDQLFLIEQLPALIRKHPDLMLILVGPVLDSSYQTRIESLIRDHGLDGKVYFAGYTDAPWEFYRAADIMVFASQQEGFGTVVIEAMAYGLPVVARHLPGVNDMFVEHDKSGYLFSRAGQFQRYVSELAGSSALRDQLGGTGRAFVESHHDIRAIAAEYMSLYGFPAESRAA